MKKRLIMIMAAAIIILIGCVKDPAKLGIHPNTLYKGRVIEKSQNKPIKGVTVSVTDGSHVHTSQVTGDDGRFEFRVDFDDIDDNYSLQLDCQGYTSLKEDLKGFGQESYDYKDIVYYDNSNPSNWPNVTTKEVSEITSTTARTGGAITYSGAAEITARGVCWGTTHTPDIDGNHTTDGSGTGSFTSNLTNLSLNTTYFVRAYATNMHGTYYGEEKTFTTNDGSVVVTTNNVTNVTPTSATCGGTVTVSSGNTFPITSRGVCWSTGHNPSISNSHTTDGTGPGMFTSTISGLTVNTMYYVRAYATNQIGTYYGEEKPFTTAVGLPAVTTTDPTLNGTTVTTGGNVTSDGGYPVTARGICYGPLPNPDLTSTYSHTTDGSGTGYFSSTFSLPGGSGRYYIRAYATNANGTVYGEEKSIIQPYDELPTFTFNGHVYRVAPDPQQQPDEYVSWSQADAYCQNLTLYGFTDWRLPNIEELEMMYQNRYSIGGFVESSYIGNYYYRVNYHSSTLGSSEHYQLNWDTGVRTSFDSGHYYHGNYIYMNAHLRPIRTDH